MSFGSLDIEGAARMEAAEEDSDLATAVAMSLDPATPARGGAAPTQAVAAALRKPSAAERAAALLHSNAPGALAAADAVQVLAKLLGNIAENPCENKFRRIRFGNARITKVLACKGAEELLLAGGFVKGEDSFELPEAMAPAEAKAATMEALNALLSICGRYTLALQLKADGDGNEVRCVCALPTGGLVTGALDNVVRLYRPGEWDRPRLLFSHQRKQGTSGVLALVAIGEGAEDFASSGRDGKIVLWQDGVEHKTLTGHGEGIEGSNMHTISCLARSDGTLLSGGWDKTVRAWEDGKQVALMEGHSIAVNSVVGLSNGLVASGSGDQTIGIWKGSERLRSLPSHAVVRALCSCGGNFMASAGGDGIVRLWDTVAGVQLDDQRVSGKHAYSLAYRAETGELAAGCEDGTLNVLRVDGTSLLFVETLRLCGAVWGLAFLVSGDLAVACGDASCVVWTKDPSRAAAQAFREDYCARAGALLAARGSMWDHCYPVEVAGRRAQLNWNRGEAAQAVAERFFGENNLRSAEYPQVVKDIVALVAGTKEFSYPVEVGDGRKLTISWNRGEDPQAVARDFAIRHGGIGADELPDIINFIRQASGAAAVSPVAQQAPASVSTEMQQHAMTTVMEMGFDERTARSALQAANWNVEVAVMRLLS